MECHTMRYQLTRLGDRSKLLEIVRSQTEGVIDIGGVGNGWAGPSVTHVVDLAAQEGEGVFVGNISLPYVWDQVKSYVATHGKFGYAIATHVLEDISNPKLVCDMLGLIAKRGVLAFPSKYKEMIRQEGPYWGSNYRGYIHHRWIFNIEDGELVAYPKLGFLENDPAYDALGNKLRIDNEELQIEWEGGIDLKIVYGDLLGTSVATVKENYRKLLED